MLDHEKLDVYRLQLEFLGWADLLMEETRKRAAGKTREIRNQLDRASLSVLLNIAEGNGKRQRRTRAKSFDDARGSAAECSACLDALVAKRVCAADRVLQGKGMMERTYAMLTKLIIRFEREGD